MKWMGWTKQWLSFNRKDRIAALLMVVITIFIYLLPRFFSGRNDGLIIPDSTLVVASALSTESGQRPSRVAYEDEPGPSRKPGLFNFDPNELDDDGWEALGLQPRTIRTIRNYLSKGGKFQTRGDLSKIWGLPPGFYERVKDHIELPETAPAYANRYEKPEMQPFKKFEREKRIINLNADDSAALESLPGIGGKLAMRIIGFREKLGGFYSVEQVGETYGLPDSTFQKIKHYLQISGDVRKININTATKEELKLHPYIRWNLANAIVEFRKQHGDFKSLEDLRKIVLIDEKNFEKIRHYLEL